MIDGQDGDLAPDVDAIADPNCSAPSLTEGDANSNGTLDAGETWTYTCTAK